MNSAVIDVGYGVVGDVEAAGEGGLVFNIHRAALHCFTAGDAAVGNRTGLACCFLLTQIYCAAVLRRTVADGAACNGSRTGPRPDRAAVISRTAAEAAGIIRVNTEHAIVDRCCVLR